MKKNVAGALVWLLLTCCSGASADTTEPGQSTPIRIGWQISAATQAGLVQVLKRTDLAAAHGLEPSLIPFSYGTPQIEAALAGELDVVLAGDQPVINLLSRGGSWRIVSRAYYDRVAIIAPANAPAKTVADLAGRTVASPFGSVAHREALEAERAAGLEPDAAIFNTDMDILEIRRRIAIGDADDWRGIDAAAVWEPYVSAFGESGLARSLAENRILSVIAVSEAFLASHPEAAVRFLVTMLRAWEYLARNPEQVMRWYIDDEQLDYSPELLIRAAAVDPNFAATSLGDVDLALNEEDIGAIAEHAAWGAQGGQDGRRVELFVDQTPLRLAEAVVASEEFEPLKVILPSLKDVADRKRGHSRGLETIPLAVMFIGFIVGALLAMQVGHWLGRRTSAHSAEDMERPISTVAGAVLGMMAFVIALTFGAANSRFDARKEALLQDVTAIKTAYLRANLLPEPHRSTLRSLLRDYTQARAGIVHSVNQPEKLRLVLRHAGVLQRSMWSNVESLAADQGSSRVYLLFASSLNDVFTLHTKRVVLAAHYSIPAFVWVVLFSAACVAMVAVGFQFGIGGGRRSRTAEVALAVTFSLVMLLAFDLDRASDGMITVNQQPMVDLYEELTLNR